MADFSEQEAIAVARAKAKLKARRQTPLQATVEDASAAAPSLMNKISQGVSDVAYNTVGIASDLGFGPKGIAPARSYDEEGTRRAMGLGAAEVGGSFLLPAMTAGIKAGRGVDLAGRVAGYTLEAGKAALGASAPRVIASETGIGPKTSLAQEGNRIIQDVAIGAGIPAVADTTGTLYRKIIPDKAAIAYEEAMMSGSTGAQLGAGRTSVPREGVKLDRIKRREQTFLDNDPTQGIEIYNSNSFDGYNHDAFTQLQSNITAKKESAKRLKQGILEKVSETSNSPIIIKADDVEAVIAANQLRPEAADIARSFAAQNFSKEVPWEAAKHAAQNKPARLREFGNMVTNDDIPFSAMQAETVLRDRVESELRRLGAYDEKRLMNSGVDPSAIEKIKNEKDAFLSIKELLQDKIAGHAEQVVPGAREAIENADDVITSMIDYEGLANRQSNIFLQGQIPTTGENSLVGTIRNKGDLLTESVPILADRAELVRRQRALEAGPKTVENLQNIVKARAGNKPWLMKDFLGDMPPLLVAANSVGKIPRNSEQIKNDARLKQAVGNIATQVGALSSPDEIHSLNPMGLRSLVEGISSIAPQLFDAPQGGYQSFFNGKLNSPMDKDAHMSAALDADLPASKRAKIIGPLLENSKYVPLDDSVSPMSTPAMPRPIELGAMSNAFSDVPMSRGMDGTFAATGETARMIEMMNKSQSMIDADKSGL
jgi:ElaB/YqjD/DUF883 family membrane-anchored ribosome-binding protein